MDGRLVPCPQEACNPIWEGRETEEQMLTTCKMKEGLIRGANKGVPGKGGSF